MKFIAALILLTSTFAMANENQNSKGFKTLEAVITSTNQFGIATFKELRTRVAKLNPKNKWGAEGLCREIDVDLRLMTIEARFRLASFVEMVTDKTYLTAQNDRGQKLQDRIEEAAMLFGVIEEIINEVPGSVCNLNMTKDDVSATVQNLDAVISFLETNLPH